MMPGAFKAVFLDVGGTLLEMGQPEETYLDILLSHGHQATLDEVREWHAQARREALPLAHGVGEDFTVDDGRQQERRASIVEALLRAAGVTERFEACREAIYESWIGTRVFHLYPETADVLSQLKQAGLILAAVSNWEPRLASLMANHGIADHFDFILASEAEGHAKPGARLFEMALERAGVEPHEVLHVGDSEENDLRAAESVGIRAVHVRRQSEKRFDHSPRITSLRPLVAFATAAALIRGRVERGKGEAGGFTRIDWVRRQLIERVGFDPYPGTLNVRLHEGRDRAAWDHVRAQGGVPIEPSPGYCAARCYPVLVEGSIRGAIVLPMVRSYPTDVLEVMAPVALRQELGLDDGDPVTVAVESASR